MVERDGHIRLSIAIQVADRNVNRVPGIRYLQRNVGDRRYQVAGSVSQVDCDTAAGAQHHIRFSVAIYVGNRIVVKCRATHQFLRECKGSIPVIQGDPHLIVRGVGPPLAASRIAVALKQQILLAIPIEVRCADNIDKGIYARDGQDVRRQCVSALAVIQIGAESRGIRLRVGGARV